MITSPRIRKPRIALAALASTALGLGLVVAPPLPPIEAQAAPASFKISGSGFGHGVGMSQWGAQAQALSGRSAAQILAYYYTGTKVAAKTSGNIRVQLATSSSSITFTGGAGTVTVGATTRNAVKGEVVSLSVSGSNVVARGSVFGSMTGATAIFKWSSGGYVTVAGAASKSGYGRGQIEVTNIGGKTNVVANLPLARDYIYGVAEVPASWSPAALQAQAVAARTYALQQSLKSACNCNVYSTTQSQVYTGRDKELEPGASAGKWVAAVNATSTSSTQGNAVVNSSGALVTTYYYASSAGRTENNEDVWGGTPLAHTRSVADSWSMKTTTPANYRSWTETVSQATMAKAFGLPDVAKIGASGKTAGGSPRQIVATASNGKTATLKTTDFRSKLGLKSTWIQIAAYVDPGPAPVTPFGQIMASPDMDRDGRGEVLGVDQVGNLYRYPMMANGKLGARAHIG
ncbi:MAG: SpoIID/LytB domain-containing protein, partial [Micrococcales bacterium]|nr:SpoIID/LytB domain-containing protein [Micrococcales bacterium]